jgi:peptidoglycan/xylan/chitin deacetylase (PgdA/CDA1 family)
LKPFRLSLAGALALVVTACGSGGSAPSTTTSKAAVSGHRSASAAPNSAAAAPSGPPAAAPPALIPPPNAPPSSVRVPVLTYHRVAPLSAVGQLDLKVDPGNFAAELEALHAGGYHTIHQWQLFDALYKHGTLPSKPVLISVDDGYLDDVRTILPELQRWHMVATFFVITGRMTEPGFLSADQIRQLERAGMDIGDHTEHHVDLRQLTPSELRNETAGSRRVLDGVLGHPVYTFAYPFGAYNAAVVSAVRTAGFTLAFTTAAGTTASTTAPFTIPRVHVGRSQTPSGLVSQLGFA